MNIRTSDTRNAFNDGTGSQLFFCQKPFTWINNLSYTVVLTAFQEQKLYFPIKHKTMEISSKKTNQNTMFS